MNYPRIAIAAAVAFVLSLPVGFVVNDILLEGVYAANQAAMRPEDQITANLPLGFVFLLIGFFAFAYMYAKGYEGGSGIAEGLRFGLTAGLVIVGFGIIWQYVLYPINGTMAVAIAADSLVEAAIYGMVVGAVYKPLPSATLRHAGV